MQAGLGFGHVFDLFAQTGIGHAPVLFELTDLVVYLFQRLLHRFDQFVYGLTFQFEFFFCLFLDLAKGGLGQLQKGFAAVAGYFSGQRLEGVAQLLAG